MTSAAPVNNKCKAFPNQLDTLSVHWSGTFSLTFNRFCVRGIRLYFNNSQIHFDNETNNNDDDNTINNSNNKI